MTDSQSPEAALFGRARGAIIAELFAHSNSELHGREIARRRKVSAQSIAEELAKMQDLGIVTSRAVGNLHLYSPNTRFALYHELRAIAAKIWGAEWQLKELLSSVSGIDVVAIFGSYAKGNMRGDSDIDVLVIGEADYGEVSAAMSLASESLGRPVNAKLYRPGEWRRKFAEDNGFVVDVHNGPKIFLKGDQEFLDGYTQSRKAGGEEHSSASRATASRDRSAHGNGERSSDRGNHPRRPR